MTNDPLNLDRTGEWAGLWWLPEDPEEKVPGVLRYDAEGGLSLSLIGAFEDRITSNPAPGLTAYHEGTKTWDVTPCRSVDRRKSGTVARMRHTASIRVGRAEPFTLSAALEAASLSRT